jgi:tetratricopeptide (TPR) repeat protein
MKIRYLYLTIAAAGSFLLGTLSHAQQRFDHEVRNLFFAGFSGNESALREGLAKTEAVLKENPKHAEALVWHGGGLYYLAGQAFQKGDPQKGMELAQKGMEEMDRAVALEPGNIGVRIPRGALLMNASRFQQGPHVAALVDRAISDYEQAYELQRGQFDKLSVHSKGELLFGLADGYARTNRAEKAREFYGRAASDLPGTVYERNAKEWLEKGTLPGAKAGCLGCHTGQ